MKIRALRDYTDNKYTTEDGETIVKEIKKGDEYEVSNERGKQILSHPKNLAILIEIVKEEVKEIIEDKEVDKMAEEAKKKPKTTTKKKTTTKNTTKKKVAKK